MICTRLTQIYRISNLLNIFFVLLLLSSAHRVVLDLKS